MWLETGRSVLGLGLMLYSMTQIGQSVWLVTHGLRTTAETVAMVSYGPLYGPVVEFSAADGRRIRISGRLQPSVSLTGDRHLARPSAVWYDPDEPRLALADDAVELWLRPWAVLLIGLALVYVKRVWHWIMGTA